MSNLHNILFIKVYLYSSSLSYYYPVLEEGNMSIAYILDKWILHTKKLKREKQVRKQQIQAARTGIKLFLTRSELVQLPWNQWLYDYVLICVCMHLYVSVKLSTFHSHCAGIIVEDRARSATYGQNINTLLQIVRL